MGAYAKRRCLSPPSVAIFRSASETRSVPLLCMGLPPEYSPCRYPPGSGGIGWENTQEEE